MTTDTTEAIYRDDNSPRLTIWATVTLALVFFLQVFWGNLDKSLTVDEPLYISSGYTYLTRNDFRLNPQVNRN